MESKPALVLEARAYLGGCKVCLNCGAVSHPRRRKCIAARCRGDRFRNETTLEASARLNGYEAEKIAQENLIKELTQ